MAQQILSEEFRRMKELAGISSSPENFQTEVAGKEKFVPDKEVVDFWERQIELLTQVKLERKAFEDQYRAKHGYFPPYTAMGLTSVISDNKSSLKSYKSGY